MGLVGIDGDGVGGVGGGEEWEIDSKVYLEDQDLALGSPQCGDMWTGPG